MRSIRIILGTIFLLIFGLSVLIGLLDTFNAERPNPLAIPTDCKILGYSSATCIGLVLGKLLFYVIPLFLGYIILPSFKALPPEQTIAKSNIETKTHEPTLSKESLIKTDAIQNIDTIDDNPKTDSDSLNTQKSKVVKPKEALISNSVDEEKLRYIDDPLQEFTKAKVALEYRVELRNAWTSSVALNEHAKREILLALESEPRMGIAAFEKVVIASQKKYDGPFEKLELNEIYFDLQKQNADAAVKFKSVIVILGEDTDPNSILKKVKNEFNINNQS